ncbi:hypothetical protein GS429_09850 [Natronorubrum sp. JWXQ-INN-674]|uniref:Uncharacterized protein n=1 Tax=Natronorubrum halalkaliphilum TaxID=2691917 RepID=A0A6B0VP96_9EURY|nr:hypothetical protein [Natronorubrum halalkaliphilum]MXV62359.1 hypothetical protein [Natronorubrum halalkaliphilum]
MHRRSLLAGVGCSSLAVAGCLPVAESAVGQEEPAPEPPSNPDEPIARAVLGSPSTDVPPHRVRLWNRTDERRTVALEIESESGVVSFDGSYELDADAHIVVLLHGRDRYSVTVSGDEITEAATELERSSFDDACPGTELFVLEDGQFEVTTDEDADHCD